MILCLDLETTGLDEQHCGIIEIGACWLHSGESFHRQCRPLPTCDVEARALEINGAKESALFAPSLIPEELAICEFIGWVRGARGDNSGVQLAAWNAHFDHRHLCAGMARAGIEPMHRPFLHRLLDVHSILAGDALRRRLAVDFENVLPACGGEILNCDEGSRLLGLEPEPKPHAAARGAAQVRAMLRRLLGDLAALP